mmetsp:Transcript_11153/g.21579  ORF Transcript_11153/g.21579 Transcript_11153/m.21579 type:complete len:239 (+) Transcript_11153:421-1137(+)
MRLECIPCIAVYEVIIHRKIIIVDPGGVVLCRGHPTTCAWMVLGPCVADGLVPSMGKGKTTIIVVAQNPKPLLSVKTFEGINTFVYSLPLPRMVCHPRHGCSTLDKDATPVEVVAHVQHIVRRCYAAPDLHLLCDLLLCTIISTFDERPVVGWHVLRPTVRRHWLSGRIVEDTTPITNNKNMMWTRAFEACLRQGNPVEFCAMLRRLLWHSEPACALETSLSILRTRRLPLPVGQALI